MLLPTHASISRCLVAGVVCVELSIAGPSFIVRSRRTICGFLALFWSMPVVVEDRRSSGDVRRCSAICSLCDMVEAILLLSRPMSICGGY